MKDRSDRELVVAIAEPGPIVRLIGPQPEVINAVGEALFKAQAGRKILGKPQSENRTRREIAAAVVLGGLKYVKPLVSAKKRNVEYRILTGRRRSRLHTFGGLSTLASTRKRQRKQCERTPGEMQVTTV